ncbi:annexin B10-like isoform X2 [Planococcus citri]|uniref:annexin B10-like isoform X2 n=1 Tax=Planococcus citri TaxID=170843 RepID=UPI0031F7B810
MYKNYPTVPTVKANPNFNVPESGTILRNAMKGFGTDEDKIIATLTSCNLKQRQEIAKYFERELNRDLEKDLRSELGGNFESLIVGLITPPVEYLARQLNKAFKGVGTDGNAVIEILVTRSNEELKELVNMYEKLYDRPLAEHLASETSGDFRKFLTFIGVRNPPGKVNADKAQELAEQLFKAGEGTIGTKEEVFNRILSHESYDQLKLVFEKYKAVSGHTIEQALNSELSGDLKTAMLAIVECVQSPPTYFAKQLNKAMKGNGTDDQTLIRIIVSRSEIDLENIKREYERLYDKTLESAIKSETSGDYKKALIALLGGA